MELELASIETYLVGFPPEIKNNLKEILSDKFFARQVIVKAKKKEKFSGNTADLIRLLEKLIEFVKKNHPI